MKEFLLASVAATTLCCAPALAADVPVKAPVIKTAPMFDWSGFYAGASAGYGWGSSTLTAITNSDFAGIGDQFPTRPRGALAGGQVGYNWQIGQSVLGVELSGAASSMKDTTTHPDISVITGRTKFSTLWTATAKLGFAADRNLIYVKGGYAGARIDISAVNTNDNVSFGAEKTRSGWTIGAGWDYALTPDWILGFEFNHHDLGSEQYSGLASNAVAESFAVRSTVQSVLARVSYRFGS